MFSLLIRQPAKGNAVINGNLANGVNGVLDMRFVGVLFGHGNFPSLDHKCGAKALFAFALLIAHKQGQAAPLMAVRSAVHLAIDGDGWCCYSLRGVYSVLVSF